jgi:hypothetical protein
MARLFDRIKETTTSTGTGTITLAGAATRHKAFSAVFAVGDQQISYCIEGQTGTEWEVGLCTYSGANTLTRDKVYASSNSDNIVNFSAGTKDVFVTMSAEVGAITGRQNAQQRGMAMP